MPVEAMDLVEDLAGDRIEFLPITEPREFLFKCVCVCVCVCARARAFMYVDTIYTHNAYLCTYISVQRPEPNYSCNLARPDSARGAILGKVLGVHLSDVLLLLRLLLLELPQAAHHAPITARRRRKESRQPCKRQTPGTDAAEA